MTRELSRLVAPLARRIRLMAARAVITLIDDAAKLQSAQVKLLADEVRDRVERFQQYGFTAVPLPGAEGVYLSLGGTRDHGVLICVDDRRYRPKGLQGGEAAMYNHLGDIIHIKADRSIGIIAATKITITTPLVEFSGNLQVAGSIVAQGDISDQGNKSMAGMRATFNGHTHPGDSGGTTGAPNQGM